MDGPSKTNVVRAKVKIKKTRNNGSHKEQEGNQLRLVVLQNQSFFDYNFV